MKFEIPIPELMKDLRIDDRGYPIPFFVPIIEGKPNFKFASERKQFLALEKNLCWVCGKKLTRDNMFFICGPLGLKNRVGSDTAMHRVCAEFSLRVCPHLHFQKARAMSHEDAIRAGGVHDPTNVKEKPQELYLVKITSQKPEKNPYSKALLVTFKPISSERWIYQDNILIKENEPL